jgi:hypothetical protein
MLALNSQSFCLSFLGARIIGMSHDTPSEIRDVIISLPDNIFSKNSVSFGVLLEEEISKIISA